MSGDNPAAVDRGRRLSGTELAAAIRARVASAAAALTTTGRTPRLAVVLATKDESAAWYVRSIAKAAAAVGISCDVVDLAPGATADDIRGTTRDLTEHCRRADVLVAAVGRPGLVTAQHVTPSSIVIDVGTTPTEDGGLAGDVAPEVAALVSGLTPVPGGVGPVTTALLLEHTVRATGEATTRGTGGDMEDSYKERARAALNVVECQGVLSWRPPTSSP